TTARMITCSIKLAIVQRHRSQKERQSAYRKPATQGGLQATLTASPPRRQFSDDDKARVVSEAMMAGSSVAAVARRHSVCASLI
ncbi:transposase, partial [Novosphingobium sp. FKTRR1]|uniref:transposase n=1 Tax=Novosphingobium sp. FKTRR1 TaxID=2879118 RepID=UPI001CF0A8AA